jgi:putative transposase
MNKRKIDAFAHEAAKGIKTESDLNDFRQILTKIAIETALHGPRLR